MSFDLRAVSDNGYLVDYGLPDLDRLRSELALSRIKRDTGFRVGLIHYKSLRDNETDDETASEIVDVNFVKRFFPSVIGGEFRFDFAGRYAFLSCVHYTPYGMGD